VVIILVIILVVSIYFAYYKMQQVERDLAAIENSVTRAAKDMGCFPMKPKQIEATYLFMQGNDMFVSLPSCNKQNRLKPPRLPPHTSLAYSALVIQKEVYVSL